MSLSHITVSLVLAALPLAAVIFALYSTYMKWQKPSQRRLAYPPGPSPNRLFSGNADVIPSTQPWKTYVEWGKEYGVIIHLRLYTKHMLILNSIDDATELLEKRSGIYSSRIKSTVIKLIGWDFHVGHMAYGDDWRLHRRLYQQCFRAKASHSYQPIQTKKIHEMLRALLSTPDDFKIHSETALISIMMSVLYGQDLTTETNNYFISLAADAFQKLFLALAPGPALIDSYPLLRYLPSLFTGGAKNVIKNAKMLTEQIQDVPMDGVGKNLLKGTAGPSLVADLLENCYMQKEYTRIKQVAATSYVAGSHTTVSSINTFFLAMAMFPAAQKNAQDEIDEVIGSDRLPNYDDRASLPYVEALLREILRWRPTLPLCVAHMNTADDLYKGYYIPKGTALVANIWAMTRDEEKYPEPECFKPERFINKEGQLNNDDMSIIFGFGRRSCPGRHLATATVWLSIVSLLATFNIRKKKDEKGEEISLEGKYTDDLISHPLPFECSITPRRVNTSRLIHSAIN